MKVLGKLLQINIWLLIILAAVFVLRVPSFFEPYWYGDEGIYLVLGQMMQRGAVLYRDIWDNKPPILYLIYAVFPTLLWAKAVATLFVLGTCAGVYKFTESILKSTDLHRKVIESISLLATIFVGIFLSIPIFEGTIANAELFFTLPIVLGAYLIRKSIEKRSNYYLIISGLLMSVAFLIKVPALFDFAGIFLAAGVIKINDTKNISGYIRDQFLFFFPVISAFLVPIAIVVGYFYFNHALADFLVASFSQNASYVAIDSGPFSRFSNPLFVKGIILAVISLILGVLYLKRRITKELLFLAFWFGFSLYGALLSNRPYMHYLLQVVPPVIVLSVYLFSRLRSYWLYLLGLIVLFFQLSRMFAGAFFLHPSGYYQNWFDYVSERKSWKDYVNFFDQRTLNSYAVAEYLDENSETSDSIFVWGDAALVYVLSNRPATTKFIQAHHLTTIDPKNYDLIISRLNLFQPKFILISRPEQFSFPKLEAIVSRNYRETAIFQDLHVYQNIIPATPVPWNPNYN